VTHPIPLTPVGEPPSLVELIVRGTFDADLAALVWMLVEGEIPLVVGSPPDRMGAGAQLLRGVLASVRPEIDGAEIAQPLTTTGARKVVLGRRAGGLVGASSLEDVFRSLGRGPLPLSEDELTFLGCVLVLGSVQAPGASSENAARPQVARGRLRVVAAHYVRPLARDAHGHAQRLGPAVLATWDPERGRYEHFSWGVLPEIAARLGRRAGDLERDLHHRRDDLAGLSSGGVTSLAEVRRLIAGYQAGYGDGHHQGGDANPH
jgi:hypothetical protein